MRHTRHTTLLHCTSLQTAQTQCQYKLCTDGRHGIRSVLSSQQDSGCVMPSSAGGGLCLVFPLSLTPLSSLSPLASGHDDWRPGARRGEQTWSAEGGGGALSVRGVTSQQSGVMRVMIPVRVVITRQMAAPEIKHPLTPSEVTHWVTFSQTSNKTHSKYLHCDKSDMLM